MAHGTIIAVRIQDYRVIDRFSKKKLNVQNPGQICLPGSFL